MEKNEVKIIKLRGEAKTWVGTGISFIWEGIKNRIFYITYRELYLCKLTILFEVLHMFFFNNKKEEKHKAL